MNHRTWWDTTVFGRDEELRRLAALVRSARNGRSGALAIRGDPGIGKSTLLRAATGPDVHLLRVDGFESESTIPFAALQRLGRPLREHLPALPERQQLALRTAVGVADGPPPDLFLVGLGMLGLLAEAGRHAPIVCTVDDAHWLDPESLTVLAFVARRLEAESVALVFALRDDPRAEVALAGVPVLRLVGLDRESAVRLLASALPERLDPHAAARIAAATGGNPLALVDLARELSVRELAFVDEPIPVGTRLEAHYLRQARQAPADAQRWLIVAAADSTGNLDLITAAAAAVGTAPEAGDLAELAGLVTLGGSVRFRHPLVRAAVYNAAPGVEQRRAHAALSAAAATLGLVEQSAWHAAKATLGADEAVAARLEHAADLAGRRGGFASRATVLARAADLTPRGPTRWRRLIAAAEAALAAGAAVIARALLADIDADPAPAAEAGPAVEPARSFTSDRAADRADAYASADRAVARSAAPAADRADPGDSATADPAAVVGPTVGPADESTAADSTADACDADTAAGDRRERYTTALERAQVSVSPRSAGTAADTAAVADAAVEPARESSADRTAVTAADAAGDPGADAALDPVSRGRIVVLRATIAVFSADPVLVRATADLLGAAELFHGRDPGLEQATLLKAFEYALPAERLRQGVPLDELGRRLDAGADVADGPAAVALRGLAALVLLPYEHAVPVMRAAVDALRGLSDRELLGYGAISVALTTALWDAPARGELLVRVAETARQAGALLTLDTALWVLALTELNGGTVTRAVAYNEQVREVRRAMGYDAENVVNAALMAWTEAPREHVVAVAEGSRSAGFGGVHTSAVGALAIRDLAEGHYRDAYRRLKPLIDDPFLQVTPLQFADYAEAAVRAGRTDDARTYAAQLGRLADVNGSPWCRGVAERSRALVAPDDAAEAHYRAALDALAATDAVVELGRTHLLYGEWLRRVRRRRDARAALHAALAAFDRSGAHLFAQRALAELAAIGERPTAGPPDALDLTPRELTIARLAAAGQTNAEIAATLFISPNTVDYHLRKVFQKLGISSRRQLSERLS